MRNLVNKCIYYLYKISFSPRADIIEQSILPVNGVIISNNKQVVLLVNNRISQALAYTQSVLRIKTHNLRFVVFLS